MKSTKFKKLTATLLVVVMFFLMLPLSAINSWAASNIEHIENSSGKGVEFEFLGKGFNALNSDAQSISKDSISLKNIINYDAVEAFVIQGQSTETFAKTATSAQEMMLKLGIDYTSSAGLSVPIDILKVGFENKFSFNSSVSYDTVTETLFYYYVNETISEKYALNFYDWDYGKKEILSDNFIKALDSLQADSSQQMLSAFFDDWGTHMLTSYNKGAYLEFWSYAYSTSTDIEIDASVKNEFSASASLSDININAATSFSVAVEAAKKDKESNHISQWKATGGDTSAGATLETAPEKNQEKIDAWASTITDETKDIIPRTTQWVPIWEMIPEEYADVSAALQEYYRQIAVAKNIEFFDSFTSYSDVVGTDIVYVSPTGYVSELNYGIGCSNSDTSFKVAPGSAFYIDNFSADLSKISTDIEVTPAENAKYVTIDAYGVVRVSSETSEDTIIKIIISKKTSGDEVVNSSKIFIVKKEGAGLFEGGYGTKQRPYLVGNSTQFNYIRNYESGNYLLTNDIDLSSVPMIDKTFTGTLDGNRYKLYGWRCSQSTAGNVGLFSIIGSGGVVKNLVIEDFIMSKSQDPTGTLNAGLLCGVLNGQIENVTIKKSSVSVDMGSLSAGCNNYTNAGIFVGKSSGGKIITCGSVDNYVYAYTGTGKNGGESHGASGGIIGKADGSTKLSDSYSHGNTIIAHSKYYDGWNWGAIEGNAYASAGGLIGNTDGTSLNIVRCLGYANSISADAEDDEGDDDDQAHDYAGSLIGHLNGNFAMSSCYSESGDILFGEGSLSGASNPFSSLTAAGRINDLSGFKTNGWTQAASGGHPYIAQNISVSVEGKTHYYLNEAFDFGSLVIKGDNDSTEVKTNYKISGYYPNTIGEQTITVAYGNLSGSYKINVVEPVVEKLYILEMPNKTTFFEDENVDYSGIRVIAEKSNRETFVVEMEDLDISCSEVIGSNVVFVKYGDLCCEFSIEIYEILPSSIEVEDYPTQNFVVGDEFSSEGLTICVKYNNGYKKILSNGFNVDISKCSLNVMGTYPVNVIYAEKGATCETYYNVVVGVVESIEILSLPDKTSYFTSDEKIETDGLVLNVTYTNGITQQISNLPKSSVSGFDNSKIGIQDITVDYCGATASFEIQVIAVKLVSIDIISFPKTVYYDGDSVKDSDLLATIKAKYNDGTERMVYDGYNVVFDGYGINELPTWDSTGIKNATVYYTEDGIRCSDFFQVEVQTVEIVELQLSKKPTKTVYKPGETFDENGMVVKAIYNNGKAEEISGYFCSSDLNESGIQNVVVWYAEKSIEFNVYVLALNNIVITALPNKVIYEKGETLDVTGMEVYKEYENGSIELLKSNDYTVVSSKFDSIGVKTVSVEYMDKIATFEVTVNEMDVSLKPQIIVNSVQSKPGKSVMVNVDVKNNPGVIGAILTLNYDTELSLVKVEAGEAWSSLDFTPPGKYATTCNFIWEGIDEEASEDGTIIQLTFAIPENAKICDYYNVSVSHEDGNIIDGEFNELEFYTFDGTITVLDYVDGDVNEDGRINTADIIMLRRYLAGGYGASINVNAADVNKDGRLNVADIVFMRRYLAGGYDIKFTSAFVVQYDANGGTGTMSNSVHGYSVESELSLNEFTKDGCYFLGWSTDPSATEAVYVDNATIFNIANGNITLYAVWSNI